MHTHIAVVLDSSGSMEQIEEDTKGGFNSFLSDQRDEDGSADVTLIEFNTQVNEIYRAKPVDDASKLDDDNYTPSGRTALHDAIMQAIDSCEEQYDDLDADDIPDNTICLVLTDGRENASETPQDTVRERVEKKQDEGWEFLFIGAEEDTALQASELGVGQGSTLQMQHSGAGVVNAFSSATQAVNTARSTGTTNGLDEDGTERFK